MIYLTSEQEQRFWSKVDIQGPDDCWNWQAGLSRFGYGRFKLRGQTDGAHRISFITKRNMKDQKNCVLHKCDNPKCVNSNHLFEGTKSDNGIDMSKKGRGCYTNGKLNSESVKVIKWMLKYKPKRGLVAKLGRL